MLLSIHNIPSIMTDASDFWLPLPPLLSQVDELQNTNEDEQKGLVGELRTIKEEKTNNLEDGSGVSEAMAVD